MQLNDPSPESKPVLIVSDGEEGHLIEKVIIEQNTTQPTTAETKDDSAEKNQEDASTAEQSR